MTHWGASAVKRPFRLWSIRFSHYVEKVRWTMDLYQVPTPMMPVTHFHDGSGGAIARASAGDR